MARVFAGTQSGGEASADLEPGGGWKADTQLLCGVGFSYLRSGSGLPRNTEANWAARQPLAEAAFSTQRTGASLPASLGGGQVRLPQQAGLRLPLLPRRAT